MEYIYNSENIELALDEVDEGVDLKVTLNDKYGHYDCDFELSNNQAYDLLQALKSIEGRISKNKFE